MFMQTKHEICAKLLCYKSVIDSTRLTLLLQKLSTGFVLKFIPTISSVLNLCQLSSDMFLESLTCQKSVETHRMRD